MTSPPSGAYRPEITLIAVVLPEPFGPTNPRISPAATWKLSPSSAKKPPKRFTRPETLRMAALSGDMPAPAGCQRHQASREEQHEPHDQQTIDQLEILRGGEADQIVDAVEDDDADDRTRDRSNATKQRKDDGKNAELAAEDIVGIEYRDVPGIDASRETGNEGGGEPCDHPHADNTYAGHRRAHGVFPHRL